MTSSFSAAICAAFGKYDIVQFSCRRTKCISMDSETVWKALYRNDSWN